MKSGLQTLLEGLSGFGLDPREWCLEVERWSGPFAKLSVYSLSDNKLWLEGWAAQGQWINLTLGGL